MNYREDPVWVAAQKDYVTGIAGGTAWDSLMFRLDAVERMKAIELRHESSALLLRGDGR